MKSKLEQKIKEAINAETKGDSFSASFLYAQALDIARKLNDSEAISLCKKKVIETNKGSEYKNVVFEQEVPQEEIEKVLNPILEGTLEKTLKKIGASPYLYPKISHVKENAQTTIPISLQIASVSVRSSDGHLVKGGSDGNTLWFAKMYSINQGMITELFLSRIFTNLQQKGLDKNKLMDYFRGKGIFLENNLKIIDTALDAYFRGDHVSCLHTLVPQFENVFLYVSERLGLDIISLNRGKEISTQMKTLSSEHLTSSSFQNVWGTDFCEQLKFTLFDPLGYELRHKIAHGKIDIDECNISNSNLLLYFFLVIAARVATKTEK